MANGITMSAEEFTDSVAQEISKQLNIKPDVLIGKLVDSLSKGLIDKLISKPISQPIQQRTQKNEPESTNRSAEKQPPLISRAIEETIVAKIPALLDKKLANIEYLLKSNKLATTQKTSNESKETKIPLETSIKQQTPLISKSIEEALVTKIPALLNNIELLLNNTFDKKATVQREDKLPHILKSSMQKLSKQLETSNKLLEQTQSIQEKESKKTKPKEDSKDKSSSLLDILKKPFNLLKDDVKSFKENIKETGILLKKDYDTISSVIKAPFSIFKRKKKPTEEKPKEAKVEKPKEPSLLDILKKPFNELLEKIKALKEPKEAKVEKPKVEKPKDSSFLNIVKKSFDVLLEKIKALKVEKPKEENFVEEATDKKSALEKIEKPQPVFITGFTKSSLQDLSSIIPDKIQKAILNTDKTALAILQKLNTITSTLKQIDSNGDGGGGGGLLEYGIFRAIWSGIKWAGRGIWSALEFAGRGIMSAGRGIWSALNFAGRGIMSAARGLVGFGGQTAGAGAGTAGVAATGATVLAGLAIGGTAGTALAKNETFSKLAYGDKDAGRKAMEQYNTGPLGLFAIPQLFRASYDATKAIGEAKKARKSLEETQKKAIPLDLMSMVFGYKNISDFGKAVGSGKEKRKMYWDEQKQSVVVINPDKSQEVHKFVFGKGFQGKPETFGVDGKPISEKPWPTINPDVKPLSPGKSVPVYQEKTASNIEIKPMAESIAPVIPINAPETKASLRDVNGANEDIEIKTSETAPGLKEETEKSQADKDISLNNNALEKIANNSDKSNENIANLVVGFNVLAKALEKLGVSIGDNMKPSTTVINAGKGQNSGSVARSTEFAKLGNPIVSDFRRFVEGARPEVA